MAQINLIQGDCRQALQQLKSNSVHLVLTDPPYFLDGLNNKWKKGSPLATRATGSIGGLPVGMKFDPQQGRKLYKFIVSVAEPLKKVLKPGGFAIFFSQPRLVHRMACGLEDVGFEIRDLYAWHFTKKAQSKAFGMQHFINKMNLPIDQKAKIKKSLEGKKTAQLRPEFESMILAQKPKQGTYVQNWLKHQTGLMDASLKFNQKMISTVMPFEKPPRAGLNTHLTVKPVPLLEQLISMFSRPGQKVLDPFLGSGSTAVACQNTGRACLGIEVNSDYLRIAENRIQAT